MPFAVSCEWMSDVGIDDEALVPCEPPPTPGLRDSTVKKIGFCEVWGIALPKKVVDDIVKNHRLWRCEVDRSSERRMLYH